MSGSKLFTPKRRKPAHRAKRAPRTRLTTIGGLLTATAVIGGGAFVGLVSVGGTYAAWNGSIAAGAPAVDSGAMIVRVGSNSTGPNPSTPYVINTSTLPAMFPGDIQQGTYYVDVDNNPSTLTSDVYIRTTAVVPSGFELNVVSGACTGMVSGHLISTSDVFLGNWGSHSTNPICVQLSIPLTSPSATQGTNSGAIEFIITAKQTP